MDDLKALSDAATQGVWGIYPQTIDSKVIGGRVKNAKAELTLQVDQTPEIGDTLYLLSVGGLCPATTGCGPTSGANAAFITALVNAYRAGTIGDTAAADKAGYERGLREAAELAGVLRDIAPNIEVAILAKLENG